MDRFSIRPATAADIDMLLAESKEMCLESPRFKDIEFDDEKATKGALEIIESGGYFIAEDNGNFVGMVCGSVKPLWYSQELMGYDLFVYVAYGYRGSLALWLLVRRFEDWCWSQGAKTIDLGIISEVAPEKTIKAYAKLGYELTGYACTKVNPNKE